MKNLEVLPQIERETVEEAFSKKEHIFDVLVINEIISAFSDDLLDAGFEKEEVDKIEKEIESYSEQDIKGILSLPKELRLRKFPEYLKDIENGKKTFQDMVVDLTSIAKRNSYTLGFHATNNEIFSNGNEWEITGTELDDRDNMSMAYYSLDYRNIFRAHRFKWLYIIRAQTEEGSTHKRDTSNNWGRAPSLPIIHEINLVRLDEQVEEIYREQMNQESKKDAS
jgi:hypothetical protein